MTFYNWGRKCIAFLLTLVIAIAFSGCNPANFKSQAARTSQLVISVLSDPQTFNYALNQQSPSIFGLTFKGLTTINGKGEIEPELAESWTISADKKRIVFNLRPGLKWSDGKPLTADDVVFTYNDIAFNQEISTDIRDYLKIGVSGTLPKVQKISDRQVEFILPEPFSPFFSTTTGDATSAIAILPKHALEASVKAKDADGNSRYMSTWGTDTDPTKIITNGPYKLESYNPSQRLVFRKNPNYWRKDKQGNSQPYIERVVWQIVESTDTSLLQFRSGGLDIVGANPLSFSLLKKEEKRGKFTIYNGGAAYGQSFISFNLNKGKRNGKPLIDPNKSRWFNTVEFRQAVSYAIDRQSIVNNLFRGLGQPQNSPVDVQSKYYLSPEDGLKVYNYEPEKAKKLLLKAGFKYNAKNQLLDWDNNRVRFTLLSNAGSKTGEAMSAQIKQNLSKIGIQVDLSAIAFTVIGEKLHNTLDWECYFGGLIGSGVDPNDGANVWLTEGGLHSFNQAPQVGEEPIEGRVVSAWEKEIADLYIQGAQEFDEAKRKAIYDETQRITQEYLPYIYLVNPLSMAAIRDRIQNIKFSALGAFWNIYELKVDK